MSQIQAPADYGPVSIDLTDMPYPYPVSMRSFMLYDHEVRMAYMDVQPVGAPAGQTVVLLHSFNFSGESWHGTIDVLIREGFRVVVPDQIGFGRSSKPFIPYRFDDMALNTRRLLQSLGVERAAIVGHSMGGMLLSRFAMLYPAETTHVVLVNQIGLEDERPGRAPHYLDEAYHTDAAPQSYEAEVARRRLAKNTSSRWSRIDPVPPGPTDTSRPRPVSRPSLFLRSDDAAIVRAHDSRMAIDDGSYRAACQPASAARSIKDRI